MAETQKLSYILFVAGVTLGGKGPSGYAASVYVVGSGLEYAEVSGGSDMSVPLEMEIEAIRRGLTRVPEGAEIEVGVSQKLLGLLVDGAFPAGHPLAAAAEGLNVTWASTEACREQAKVSAVALASAQRQA